jgi:hypothetical protein
VTDDEDQEPRWDHHRHYDEAVKELATFPDGTWQIRLVTAQRASAHMLGAIYRLMAER